MKKYARTEKNHKSVLRLASVHVFESVLHVYMGMLCVCLTRRFVNVFYKIKYISNTRPRLVFASNYRESRRKLVFYFKKKLKSDCNIAYSVDVLRSFTKQISSLKGLGGTNI